MFWTLAAVAAAMLAAGIGFIGSGPARADCASSCRSAYNQCRIQTKGSPSCEGQFTRCMQGCRGR